MNKINDKLCSLLKQSHNSVKNINFLTHKINTSACMICRESDAAATRESGARAAQPQSQHAQQNIAQIYKRWTKEFTQAGISEPKQSVQFILAHIFHLNKISDLYRKFSRKVDHQTQNEIEILCKKRLSKMPVQYILGEWQFRELTLKMEPPVFIPRPETEMLIDIILNDVQQVKNKIKMLEICCGSGAISLALLKNNPNIEIMAVDKSEKACSLSMKNAVLHKLNHRITIKKYEINEENQLQNVRDQFDVIVSNPPYVPTKDVQSVQPEIRIYEDLDALDGGPDGLNIIKSILLLCKEKLIKGGKLYLETDPSHPIKISHLIEGHPELSLTFLKTYKDFCNKERFVKIEKN